VAFLISAECMAVAQREVERLLTKRHRIEFRDEEDFQVIAQDQVLSVVGNVTSLLTVFLASSPGSVCLSAGSES
jgi:hypothetical protein